jgi:hypothetical protein
MALACGSMEESFRRMLKKAVSKAAGSSATATYPWGTLQGDGRLRTTLADFFSILPSIEE